MSETIDATDSAIELAEEHGVDLAEVTGTGADGRIVKSDVEDFLEAAGDAEDGDEAAEEAPSSDADLSLEEIEARQKELEEAKAAKQKQSSDELRDKALAHLGLTTDDLDLAHGDRGVEIKPGVVKVYVLKTKKQEGGGVVATDRKILKVKVADLVASEDDDE